MFEATIAFFTIILYQPLFNSLVLLYDYIPGHDFGIAVILLTLIIKIVLFPLSVKAVRSQRTLQKLQPKIQEVQEKYKNDKERQAKEMLDVYKQEKINPFSGLLLAFIQLPILIALYRVFWNGLKVSELKLLYAFVLSPGKINPIFLGIMDMSKPNFYLAVAAGIMQYFQTKMLLPATAKKSGSGSEFADMMQKQMTYIFPFFTVLILIGLPSALGLYWVASGIFTVLQQYFILKNNDNK